jgi:exodeoxyribonuclease V alpha subunit
MLVRYPDGDRERRVMYSKLSADRLALAYALTIHKSQGSEWPWVVVLVHSTHTRMLTRQLLYTAITRARTGVVIVGDAKGLERAVAETRDARRNTALVERLRAA